MTQAPFTAAHELYHKLSLSSDARSIQRRQPTCRPTPIVPICKSYLPGEPRISLQNSPAVREYLAAELITRDLNQLAFHLWLVAKQDSSHISSLTHQIVRGREIIITEEPELHLVWIYDRVYIKPIPKFLLSHAFWAFYLTIKDPTSPGAASINHMTIKAALGFLRSYASLIRHKSDFSVATKSTPRLIPKGISHAAFITFISNFEKIGDDHVSQRYQYGELRLTRLNFWTKIFLRRFTFHKVHGQYGAYFGRFYGPILFVFGIFSVALSAMQVALAVQTRTAQGRGWVAFGLVSRGFAVYTLVCVTGVVLFLVLLFLALGLREVMFAHKARHRKRKIESA
ncbi:MAG: hypothetical protein LQ347_006148 [Umbilicaria vellea]|nr:MAG: hypothetical protein LQ347_006148 [Umbilicaria vellea]